MPRRPRLHVPGGCYHVTLRGNHREAIFGTPRDRNVLNEIVADVVDRCDARVHAFCWMTNHLHMLIQVPKLPLGSIVQRIAQRYSRYRHKRLNTNGHLFERRHNASLVADDVYFLTVLKYIHMNPVAACLVTEPSDYPWSSHRCYVGTETISWITTDFGLSLFSKHRARARAAYREFISQPLSDDDLDLIAAPHSGEAGTIGTDRYLERLEDAAQLAASRCTLSQVIDEICTEYDTTVEQLRSPLRGRAISAIRAELAARAINEGIASLSDVARLLQRNPSSIYRLVDRHRCAGLPAKGQK
jgi:putative transposase